MVNKFRSYLIHQVTLNHLDEGETVFSSDPEAICQNLLLYFNLRSHVKMMAQ